MADAPPGAELAGPLTLRGVIGVLGALVLYRAVTAILELTVVANVGGISPDDPAYFAIRNRPAVLGAKIVYNSLSAILAGYLAAKVAGEREMHYGRLAALVVTAELLWLFLGDDYARFTPVWMRVFMVVSTGPMMLVGASIRGRARVAQDEAAAAEPREPRTS